MNQAIERLARILDVDIEPGSSSWMIRLSAGVHQSTSPQGTWISNLVPGASEMVRCGRFRHRLFGPQGASPEEGPTRMRTAEPQSRFLT